MSPARRRTPSCATGSSPNSGPPATSPRCRLRWRAAPWTNTRAARPSRTSSPCTRAPAAARRCWQRHTTTACPRARERATTAPAPPVLVELARIFANMQTRNDVIFLVTDGEETGLRGAIAFAERHPLMARVGVVVNVEARGASGPSLMFETGPGNAQLMDSFREVRDAAVRQFGELRSLSPAAQRHGFHRLSQARAHGLQLRLLEFGVALSLAARQPSLHRHAVAAASGRTRIRSRRRRWPTPISTR